MKHLITSILMLAAFAAYSQDANDTIFPLHDAKWVVEYNYWNYPQGLYQYQALDYYTLGDTTDGKLDYKKVTNIYDYGTWTRVDSLTVHILTWDDAGNKIDTTVMDFGLNVGDTLWHIFGGVDTALKIYTWVDSITYVTLADQKLHKRIHIASSDTLQRVSTAWIEGMGDTHGVFQWLDSQENPGVYKRTYTTTCYFNEGFKVFSAPSPSGKFDCDQIVVVTTVPPIKSVVSTTPDITASSMNGKIFIQNKSDQSGTAIIYNLNGQIVWNGYLAQNGNNTSQVLLKGMYLVRFNSQTVKVIIYE